MGDTQYPYPVALQWKEDPDSLKKLKNKLLLYFQKRSKSNGGECEIRDTDCSRGYILIHFKEEKDRDGVLQKDSHELILSGGKKMNLDVRSVGADSEWSPPVDSREDLTPQPSAAEAPSNQSQHVTQEPPSSSLILIENLQDKYTSEMLNLLVENVSEKNENTDFQVERIPEKQCAVITFTCDIDILRFVERFSRNSKIQSLKMTAKPLEETRSIRVEGLPTNTPEEYISLFFENPKHGVPGSTEETLVIPDEDAALLTFSTVEAAKKVLGRKHLFNKKDVSVYPYYPEQDIVLYGDQRPQIRTPEPLTFPVSPYILEFILGNDQFKYNMENTMGTHTCEIKWPDLICPKPVITLCFSEAKSTHLRTLVKLVPTWKDEVHAEFSRLISKYKVVKYKMDQSVWDAVKEHASSSTYNRVLIKPKLGSGKFFLVGLLEDVTGIDPTFKQLVEETTKQVQRKSQSMTETLPISPALYQIMFKSGLQKKILDQVPELKMDYDVPKKEIQLFGLRDEVLTAKCEILTLQNQLENKSTQMNPHLALSLKSTDKEERSRLISGSQSIHAEKESSGNKDTPDDEVTLDPPSSLVLIENVQDSCTSEKLNLLVENTSEKVEDTDFYVEIIPEIQSAVVTFTCDIDILSFITTFSSNLRAVHSKLTARPLEESRSVRVENVPENTSKANLTAFFENPEQGGGRVEDIVMLPEERAALITFRDTRDVKRVLKKGHVFSKKKLSVYPYYPMLGIALYGKDGPCIEIPKPIEFNISPYILQHICNNEGLKNNIDVKMKDKHCEIKWPDQDCQDPVLQLIFPPTLSTHLRSMTKIVPRWKADVYNEFSLLISKFRLIEYKMDELIWEAIREHVSSSTYDGVLIKPVFGRETVFLVGLSKDVTRIDPTFRQLVEEAKKQVERKKQTKTDTIPMSPALYQIMCNSGMKKKILDQVPELKMDYDMPSKAIRLSGLRDEVLTAKCEILDLKQQIKSKPIQMNPYLIQFLMSTNNEELSSVLFVHHNINAMLKIEDDTVQLTAYSKKDLTEAQEQMNQELICREVPIEKKSILKSPEWGSLHSHLLESYNAEKITVLILESYSGAENNVVITGLTSNVDKCYQKVSDFLEKNTPMNKNIKVKSMVVMQFLKEEKKQMLDGLKNVNLEIHNKIIRLRGPRLYVAQAHSHISNVLHSICSDTLIIDKPGAKKFYVVNEKNFFTMAMTTYRCLIRLQKKEEEEETEENEPDEMEGSQCQVSLPNGMVISVHKENLCHHRADVIVNGANENLKHDGGLALALLKAAGPKLQDDSDHIVKTEGRLSVGESVITDSGRLPCKQVIHTVGPRWYSEPPGKRERLLQKAITSSLELAEEYCHTSIAIPAISSGIFGCPVDQSAENIIKAVKEYVESKPKGKSTLKKINLVDTNVDTIRIFTSTLKMEFGEGEAEPSLEYRVKRAERVERPVPSERVYESRVSANQMMTKENIVIRVREGFIQDVATDVIVNSVVGANLDLNSGAISKALLSRAGSNMQQLLNNASLGTQRAPGSVFSTDGCNLNCQEVLHVVAPQWDNGQGTSETILRTIIKNCLALAERNQRMSISFPAIGIGILGFPKDLVAFVMFDEIFKFSCKNKVQSLQEVHLVLHPSDKVTIKTFTSQMEKCTDAAISGATNRQSAGMSSKYFMPPKAPKRVQKLTAFQLMDGIEPVVFSLCAEDKSNVDKTKAWLLQLIDNEQAEKVITEECISELEEAEVQKISDLQKKFQVSVIYKPPDPSIRIVGLTRDVLPVSREIEKIINRVKYRKNREQAAELTWKLVEWRYDNRGTMVPFDMMTNLELEEAKNDNKAKITIEIQGHQYTVSVQGETATGKHGNQIQIQRVVKHEGDSHTLPSHWKPMGKTLVIEVDVIPGTSEYSAVQQKVQRTCRNQILKIRRVQNRDLWLNYQIKKQNIDSKNGSTNNERELFHGTDFNSIQHVNQNGFNRSYAGRNAAAYGNGTYFAVNANYSASNTYAKPDGDGQKHMYLARVLTGLYCVGRHGMFTPPAKNTFNPTDLYDSVADNLHNPSMFVIFNDIQAYPEYHIIFQ